jgi:hypothetical protein
MMDFPNTKYGRPKCSVVQLLPAAVGVFAFPNKLIIYVDEKRVIVCVVEGKKKHFLSVLNCIVLW